MQRRYLPIAIVGCILVACGMTELSATPDPSAWKVTSAGGGPGSGANGDVSDDSWGTGAGAGGTSPDPNETVVSNDVAIVGQDPGWGGAGAPSDAATMPAAQAGQRPVCQAGQSVLMNDVLNARDLGGTLVGSGANVACGVLYRGAPLADFSAQGCADFAALGVRTVIDLRMPSERSARPESACVSATTTVVLAPLPIPSSGSSGDYINDLNTLDSIATVFRELAYPTAYPVYLHCTYGRDRTGIVAALILLVLGASEQTVMQEYELTTAAGLSTFPASLQAVLDEVGRRGGVDAYLASAGISESQLAVIRAEAIAP